MLLDRLKNKRSLALIGMGKNVGKTTALNHIVREATARNIRLGLTSIGRDGELVDAISSHPKPPIAVPPGTLVATAALPERARAFEILERTTLRTAVGPVVIARAQTATNWEVSGPALGSGLQHVKERFFELGVELAIFDGAFDRRSSATPTLTDATLLVSGAALDPDIAVTIADTVHRTNLFQLPLYPGLPPEAQTLLSARGIGLLHLDGTVTTLPFKSTLNAHEQLAATLDSSVQALLIGTALTPQLLDALKKVNVVVHDGTHVLIDPLHFKRWRDHLYAGQSIHLPCLVANPYSPYGWRYDAGEFLDRLGEAVSPLPVVDVVLGESR